MYKIRKINNEPFYRVYDPETKRVLGYYKTRELAVKSLKIPKDEGVNFKYKERKVKDAFEDLRLEKVQTIETNDLRSLKKKGRTPSTTRTTHT